MKISDDVVFLIFLYQVRRVGKIKVTMAVDRLHSAGFIELTRSG